MKNNNFDLFLKMYHHLPEKDENVLVTDNNNILYLPFYFIKKDVLLPILKANKFDLNKTQIIFENNDLKLVLKLSNKDAE